MKVGDRVQSVTNGKVGVCHGPIFHYGVWWMKVKWDSGGDAYVLEEYLEKINEKGRLSKSKKNAVPRHSV